MRIKEFLDGDTWVIRAELPGMDPEKDIEIAVTGGVLTIRAERLEESSQQQCEESTASPPEYRSECRYDSYRRSVELPAGIRPEDVTARYAGGVLEVRLPLQEAPADLVGAGRVSS